MNHKFISLRLVSLASLAAVLLAGCAKSDRPAASTAAAPTAAATPGDRDAGKRAYLTVCFTCHQPTGLGLPGLFPPLAGSEIVAASDPSKIIRIVLHGLTGPITVKGATYNSIMPAQGGQLSDTQIADVLTYVRGAWDNNAPPVTVEAVAEIRAKVQRATPWTWAELNEP